MLKFNYDDRHRYDDIIDLPRHISKTRPKMPLKDRAAQFAPFAALTGHGEAVKETARLTKERIELDEDCKAQLDWKLWILKERTKNKQEVQIPVTVTYFVPDEKKSGGVYETVCGQVKRIDGQRKQMILADETRIPVEEIIEIIIESGIDEEDGAVQ